MIYKMTLTGTRVRSSTHHGCGRTVVVAHASLTCRGTSVEAAREHALTYS